MLYTHLRSISWMIFSAWDFPCWRIRYSSIHDMRWSLKTPLMSWWSISGVISSWISARGKPWVNGWGDDYYKIMTVDWDSSDWMTSWRQRCDDIVMLRRHHLIMWIENDLQRRLIEVHTGPKRYQDQTLPKGSPSSRRFVNGPYCRPDCDDWHHI